MSQMEIFEAARQEYYEDQIQTESPRMPLRHAEDAFLQDLVDQFERARRRANSAHIACFYETIITRKTSLVGLGKDCVFHLRLTIFAAICRE